MSRTENHIGQAIEVGKDLSGFDDKYSDAVTNYGLKHDEGDESDYIEDSNFFYLKESDQMFKIVKNIEDEDGHCVISKSTNDEGNEVYDYALSFYNGGGSFQEVFEHTLKGMENE